MTPAGAFQLCILCITMVTIVWYVCEIVIDLYREMSYREMSYRISCRRDYLDLLKAAIQAFCYVVLCKGIERHSNKVSFT